MSKPRVFVTRLIPERGLELIRESCDAEIWDGGVPPGPREIERRIADLDGLLVLLTDNVDARLMQLGTRLRVISNMAVGVDNIDVAAATARRLPVGNTPGVLTDATADLTFALLMAASRRLPEAQRYVRAGKWLTWGPRLLIGADFTDATLGIIGFGRIGQAVARRAQGFGMRIIYCDPRAEAAFGARRVDLAALLAQSDFVTLHVPLAPDTRHMIDAAALASMKPTAVLVNTARGPVVEHGALLLALQSGRLAAAGLDVTEPEPLPPDHPLLQLENCIVLPHIASASKSARDKMAIMAAQNLIAGVRGERLPNCVNAEVYAPASAG